MQANTIQAMIAINANRIRDIEVQVADLRSDAQKYKTDGETAFKIESYAAAFQVGKKLAKAVELQRKMKVELEAVLTTERIKNKLAKLTKAAGHVINNVDFTKLTTVEQEAMLDAMLLYFFPKKADSRKKVA